MTARPLTALRWLYRLLLHQQVTMGRAAIIGFMAGLTLVIKVGIRLGVDSEFDRLESAVGSTWGYDVGLMVPILSLVLASSTLGELVDDETLVYLWHRPTPRWILAVAAWGAALTVALPATVLPVTTGMLVGTNGDLAAAGAAALAAGLGTLAYTSVFVLVGLIVRRALIWGLVYVFIWEQFVARIGGNSSKVSIGAYPSSVLQELTDLELPRADRGLALGIVVPLVLAALGVFATARALDRADVA